MLEAEDNAFDMQQEIAPAKLADSLTAFGFCSARMDMFLTTSKTAYLKSISLRHSLGKLGIPASGSLASTYSPCFFYLFIISFSNPVNSVLKSWIEYFPSTRVSFLMLISFGYLLTN